MTRRELVWIGAFNAVIGSARDGGSAVAISVADSCLARFDENFPVASLESFRKERALACETPGDYLVVVPIEKAFEYPYVIPYNETLVGTRLRTEVVK